MERTIFASRWLLAPFYVGLAASLVVLLTKFGQKTVRLLADTFPSSSSEVITNVLSLIDLALIASLVLMVMLACYENFVSRFELEGHKYKPSWMGHVDFGDLKVKLLTSIVAISAIHVLESFMNIGPASDRELAWSVVILIAFVIAALLLAIMNRLSPAEHH
ncbi:MAG TPA: TIGR00645 family protein [Stellaceae bacterium]|nr:TIGR00645 family protein [Stellaceae bacterium]